MRFFGKAATRAVIAAAAIGCLGWAGCLGAIGDGEEAGASAGECEIAPGRVGLQRLTRDEYNRTVRDLFGVTSDPADVFPPDSSTSGFDNNAASLTTSPQLAKLFLDTAEVVAAEALVNKRDEIITCDPAAVGNDVCAREVVGGVARRVYRRPPTDSEVDDLMVLVAFAENEGDSFEAGIEYAIAAMLMAPQFLYRGVPITMPQEGVDVVQLDDHALATRLSYFLWGSTPDDTLLARADEGVLRDAGSLRAELDRMLADPKAAALYDGFLTQWLQLAKLASASPDPTLFPEFTDELRQQMLDETRLFWESLRARDGSAMEIITGTKTFASQELADLYEVSGVSGPELVSIDTDPQQRAGMLTMPAILTMTSDAQATNIVRRGVWLAETILCAAPPPPPDGVPLDIEPEPGETERERLARHRSDPSCASCHDLIDPLGFAFEGYDVLGRWRDDIDGIVVDDVGTLPDGREFAGVVELAALLTESDDYSSCVTEKLMTFALGRTLSSAEQCVVAAIAEDSVTRESKLSDLLWAVVSSRAFQTEEIAGGK
jgi:hypothetical protein